MKTHTTNTLNEIEKEKKEEVTVNFIFENKKQDYPLDPVTVKEALNSEKAKEWVESIKAEANNFLKRQSWKKVSRNKVTQMGRKIIKCKTIFKTKVEADKSCRFKTRMTMKGFMLQPGIDYKETLSPVATETSTRMVINIYLYGAEGLPENNDIKFKIDMIDIEAALLEGKLPNPVYIEFPPGLLEVGIITEEESRTKCIELSGGMYGSPKSAIQFFREYSNHLKQHEYQQNRMDPTVSYKRDEKGRTVIISVVHVDDTLIVGTQEEIKTFKITVGKRFEYTDKDGFKKHLGVWYEESRDKNGNRCMIARMNNTVESIISTFEQHFRQKKLRTR